MDRSPTILISLWKWTGIVLWCTHCWRWEFICCIMTTTTNACYLKRNGRLWFSLEDSFSDRQNNHRQMYMFDECIVFLLNVAQKSLIITIWRIEGNAPLTYLRDITRISCISNPSLDRRWGDPMFIFVRILLPIYILWSIMVVFLSAVGLWRGIYLYLIRCPCSTDWLQFPYIQSMQSWLVFPHWHVSCFAGIFGGRSRSCKMYSSFGIFNHYLLQSTRVCTFSHCFFREEIRIFIHLTLVVFVIYLTGALVVAADYEHQILFVLSISIFMQFLLCFQMSIGYVLSLFTFPLPPDVRYYIDT